MSTINEQNARQIRDPMQIEISMQVGSSAKISNYTVPSTYKSYDNTLGNAEYSMRVLADLSGDGFPLDGTAELYDPNKTPSANDGKLGFRGNVGQDVSVTITATSNLSSVSVKASGIVSITYNGTTYPAAALNIIPIGARTATLLFTCGGNNERIEIDYIVPGVALYIDNDNLVQCTLALRSNLDVADHSWEESEIEIQAYYPYDISDSFKYVMDEWPILYRAGYDADMSETRRFYLSEPVTMVDNVITIKGVDASHKLDNYTLPEQWLEAPTNGRKQTYYNKFVDTIKRCGIQLQHEQAWSGPSASGTISVTIINEQTARDYVASVMNLTLNHVTERGAFGFQFVDAGIPSVEHGDGAVFGNIWPIRKSDCGEWAEKSERNIATIRKPQDHERKFYETFVRIGVSGGTWFPTIVQKYTDIKVGGIYDAQYSSGGVLWGRWPRVYSHGYDNPKVDYTIISSTPSACTFKVTKLTNRVTGCELDVWGYNPSGGVSSFSNPNGLPGVTIEMEPMDTASDEDGRVLNYESLFKRSTNTISFTFKGDPRMQPLDYIRLYDDTKPTVSPSTWYRITSIELNHEGGGTTANIEAREWIRPTSVPDYYVLGDDSGRHIVTDDNKDILVITEGE